MQIREFKVDVHEEDVTDLHERLARTRWADAFPGSGWSYGTDAEFLHGLVEHWTNRFDWRRAERRLNRHPQFMAEVDGQTMHFYHARSQHEDARPLLLMHGWPSTSAEFLAVIDELIDPTAHGRDASQAFHVVAPTMPGFGWSGPTTEPGWHPGRIAEAVADLMTELGYDRFHAHGGDYGSVLASRLAMANPERVRGIHITFLITQGISPDDPQNTAEDLELLEETNLYNAAETAYVSINVTKPQSIAFGFVDSPVALAAWLVEKYHGWTDHDGDLTSLIDLDELLTIISTYWFSRTGGSSGRLYAETVAGGFMGPAADRVEVPVSVAVFPKELYRVPRRVAETQYNVVRWTEQPRGGHFAALEQPVLLAADLVGAFAPTT